LPYRESDSTVSGVLVTFIDVTNIVQAEEALLEADLRKDVFLATLSHELRNPLAPIRTAARLLESRQLQAKDLERAQSIISRQVNHMSSLLDDLLDVSRITRGSFVLKRQRVDVKSLLEAAAESAQAAIDAKGHTLRVDIPGVPIVLHADPVRLTQVVTNLLTNAAKYTSPGGLIEAGSRLEAGEIALYVRDNGIGIDPAAKAEIFNMFTRVSDDDRAEGGLGIGLALAKGLVERHGGRIEARSPGLGQGSEFVVTLPSSALVEGPPTAAHAELQSSRPPRRVVIADDNRDAAEMLSMVLNLSGHDVHIAYSGTEALDLIGRIKPDVAILDIGMPEMDGYQLAKKIREQPENRSIILIALTGWGQATDKHRAEEAGFDHHCTKPVDPNDLEQYFYGTIS
jgi:CheY-like chemotaxis protein/nitrogen-specific signal transduction histidine kinase